MWWIESREKNRKLEPHKPYVYTIYSIYLYVVLEHNSPCFFEQPNKKERNNTTLREEKPHICRFSLFFICTWSENIVYVYRFVIVSENEEKKRVQVKWIVRNIASHISNQANENRRVGHKKTKKKHTDFALRIYCVTRANVYDGARKTKLPPSVLRYRELWCWRSVIRNKGAIEMRTANKERKAENFPFGCCCCCIHNIQITESPLKSIIS